MFTRRHYNILADVIAQNVDNANTYANHAVRIETLEWLTADLIGRLQQDNPNFNAKRFAEAAGLPEVED